MINFLNLQAQDRARASFQMEVLLEGLRSWRIPYEISAPRQPLRSPGHLPETSPSNPTELLRSPSSQLFQSQSWLEDSLSSNSEAPLTAPLHQEMTKFSRRRLKKRGEAFLLTDGVFLLTVELLCSQSIEVLLRRKRAPTVSKRAPTEIKKQKENSTCKYKTKQRNYKQGSSIVSRKLPIVSKKAASKNWLFRPI